MARQVRGASTIPASLGLPRSLDHGGEALLLCARQFSSMRSDHQKDDGRGSRVYAVGIIRLCDQPLDQVTVGNPERLRNSGSLTLRYRHDRSRVRNSTTCC
jgi:hypothetical protein